MLVFISCVMLFHFNFPVLCMFVIVFCFVLLCVSLTFRCGFVILYKFVWCLIMERFPEFSCLFVLVSLKYVVYLFYSCVL